MFTQQAHRRTFLSATAVGAAHVWIPRGAKGYSAGEVTAQAAASRCATTATPSAAGQTYRVERSDSLSPTAWSAVADNVPGTGSAILILDSAMPLQMQRFYRTAKQVTMAATRSSPEWAASARMPMLPPTTHVSGA